jgi:uridine monophosphate synthetase
LFNAEYSQRTLHMAEAAPDFVIGFIAQQKLSADPRWIYLTPGVQLQEGKDALGQRYVTPVRAIQEQGSDIIIVGRGIISANDKVAEAKKYRMAAWQAYEEIIQKNRTNH